MTIYKTPFGTHIDLARILEVSDAVFIDRRGSGGYYVGFYIQYQLRDEPIWYEFPWEWYSSDHRPEMNKEGLPFYPSGLKYASIDHEERCRIHMVKWLQDQVNVIIEEWKKCRET